jgi:transcriptional regulator NrdR family protein
LSACSLARKCDEPRLAEPRTCVWCQGMGRGVLVGRMDGWTKALRRRARWTHTCGSTLTAHGTTTMNHPPVLKAQGVRVAPKFGGTSANVELLNPISIPSSRSDLTRPDLTAMIYDAQKSREPRNGR